MSVRDRFSHFLNITLPHFWNETLGEDIKPDEIETSNDPNMKILRESLKDINKEAENFSNNSTSSNNGKKGGSPLKVPHVVVNVKAAQQQAEQLAEEIKDAKQPVASKDENVKERE